MFSFLDKFFNRQSQKVSSAALTVAFFGLISRFVGLWRDRLLAGHFGASRMLDVYYAAFRIPDLVYNLLIVGAVSSAFLPVFYEYLTKDKNEAWRFAANVLNFLIIALVIFSAVMVLFAPQIVFLVAPGFDGASKALTAGISRILFLSPLLLGISALASALLQAFSRFLIAALAPIFYNLGIIVGILYLAPRYGIWGLAYGVVLGAFLHLTIQIPSLLNSGFRFRIFFDFKEPGFLKVVKMWLPRTLALLALQVNGIVSVAIASLLSSGSVAIFNFADNLRWAPIGIVGVAFSTAAFPAMSLAYAQGKRDLFLKRFSLAVRQALFIVIPLSVFFFILRNQIVKIILGTGSFSAYDVRITAAVLGVFSFGIFAAALLPLFTRAFFAFHNTRTPVFINVFSMAVNIILSFFLVAAIGRFRPDYAILGLPLAISIASIINLFWHWFDLKKHLGDFGIKEIKKSIARILTASAAAAAFLYSGLNLFAGIFNLKTFSGLFFQAFCAALLSVAAYLAIAFALGMEEILMLKIPATLLNWRGIKNPEPEPIGSSLDDQY